jgi:phage-related protein
MSDDFGFDILTTQMDSGVSKMRKRGQRPTKLAMSFQMTSAQVATLRTFVETTISGISRFYFTHPRTSATIEVRLIPAGNGELYSVNQVAPSLWNVNMTMEQIP